MHLNLPPKIYQTVTVVKNYMYATNLSQMLFHFQVITSYCRFCNKILYPCLLSLKLHCSSFVVLTENEVIISRSPSSLPHYAFQREPDTKIPQQTSPVVCRMYETLCFINYCIRPVVLTV